MMILVVEDDAPICEMLVEMLGLHGHVVRTASNGQEGLQRIAESMPDLVLCDIAMPVMDGYEMLQVLRRDSDARALPVIFLSALAERPNVRQGMNLGADDYITKPFTEKELLQSIQARMEKKALIDELDAFAHTVAHGLKNPLTPILSSAGLLSMGWDRLSDETRNQALQLILENARQMREIIDELLLLAHVHRSPVTAEPLDMRQVVERVLAQLDAQARQSRAVIQVAPTWPPAAGHAPWIQEVWMNYLTNALKYGGCPPKVLLGGDRSATGHSRFWVQDNGTGLTAGQQAQLFTPFTRLARDVAPGHGLGLSIVRRIVEKLGGVAGVESRLGEGCRFYFTLPVDVHRGGSQTA